jgi:hypothetical protein
LDGFIDETDTDDTDDDETDETDETDDDFFSNDNDDTTPSINRTGCNASS